MRFKDRRDAARQLADALSRYRDSHPLVLAIPRGAVAMGAELATRLNGELDLVMVRKLRAPHHPEFAVGAIDETGWTYTVPHAPFTEISLSYLESEKQLQLGEMRRRRALYTPGRPPAPIAGRTVIVVDDGLATGATMIASLHAVREHHPAWLVCAVPVAAPQSLDQVRPCADELVCLHAPADFAAVSQYYRSFPQVEDAEVVALLRAGGSVAQRGATPAHIQPGNST